MLRMDIFYLKMIGFLALGLGVSWDAHSGRDISQDTIENMKKVASASAKGNANLKYFFHDVADATNYFFDKKEKVYHYDGTKYARSSVDVANLPLCKSSKINSSIVNEYNKTAKGSKDRKGFWSVLSACVGGLEGASYVPSETAKKFNKLDTAENAKYIYGIYQLSVERGSPVLDACQDIWRNGYGQMASTSGAPSSHIKGQQVSLPITGIGNGVSRNSSAVAALGYFSKQRFNTFCGVHEIFRGSSYPTSGKHAQKTSCLDPFKTSWNRYNGLRGGNKALTTCVNKYGAAGLNTGNNPNSLRELFSGADPASIKNNGH